jgi:excisionase family DNA binding protein
VGQNYTVRQAADRLGVSEGTVYGLCTARKLGHIRLGVGRGTIRIPEEALEAFIKAATVQPGTPAAPPPPRQRLKHLRVN